jgi:hypothetical protein
MAGIISWVFKSSRCKNVSMNNYKKSWNKQRNGKTFYKFNFYLKNEKIATEKYGQQVQNLNEWTH